jgi:hypothetical protein
VAGSWCPWQDSNLQPPVPETGALSVALQGLWGDRRELNPSTAVSQTAVFPLHHDRQALCGGGGTRTPSRVSPRRLVSTELHYPFCHASRKHHIVVVRGGIEPPASAVSERRSQPAELPDTGTPCGTRTRSSALRGQKTNPYPNGANGCAASSGLEPEPPGTKIRWATDYPTRHRVPSLTRQDSNLN